MIEYPDEITPDYLERAVIADREKRRGRCPSAKELSRMRRLYANRRRTADNKK